MTRDEILALEGVELARAVAEEQGWVLCYLWHTINENGVQVATRWNVDEYRPDRNIAQAWELDGEGWYWVFFEYRNSLKANVETKTGQQYTAYADYDDLSTKAHAYATARCRAYLLAKAAEEA